MALKCLRLDAKTAHNGTNPPVRSLSHLFIYPMKSTRGIPVEETRVDVSGPVRDRRWMLVDNDGVMISQRTQPRMTLIEPRFEGDDLLVEAPGMKALRIRAWSGEGEWFQGQIWKDELELPEPDAAYSEWFSSYLRQSCRLLYLPDSIVRPVEAPWNDPRWRVSLADAYPLLLLGQASLDLLNAKLEQPVTIKRFRPNLVVAGSAAHEEDQWKRVRIGEVELALVKLCIRCAIPLIDPETGETGVEPLRTLAQYRKKPGTNNVLFAQNALVTKPGVLRVGSEIEVLEGCSD